MFLRIEKLPEKIIVGKSVSMSLAENRTAEVWQDFMRNKGTIKEVVGTELYSIQIYNEVYNFSNFNGQTKFTKWAGVEVDTIDNIPSGFRVLTVASGLYAVFLHKGLPSEFERTFHYIFNQWLPLSDYQVDDRPHFEILGKKYKNNQADSEEEVWIPIRKK